MLQLKPKTFASSCWNCPENSWRAGLPTLTKKKKWNGMFWMWVCWTAASRQAGGHDIDCVNRNQISVVTWRDTRDHVWMEWQYLLANRITKKEFLEPWSFVKKQTSSYKVCSESTPVSSSSSAPSCLVVVTPRTAVELFLCCRIRISC